MAHFPTGQAAHRHRASPASSCINALLEACFRAKSNYHAHSESSELLMDLIGDNDGLYLPGKEAEEEVSSWFLKSRDTSELVS